MYAVVCVQLVFQAELLRATLALVGLLQAVSSPLGTQGGLQLVALPTKPTTYRGHFEGKEREEIGRASCRERG